tara:strand:+ start:8858 stop:9874 length:1017 start_codon:yes stop_codon:yes gene_type:complete
MTKGISNKDLILVAGAKGMVGSAICKRLIKNIFNQSNNPGKLFNPSKEELNYLDKENVFNWFELNKPNIVIIAAARVGGILANSKHPTSFLLENLRIQNNLIEASWKFGVRRLLFLGSSCIYPKFASQPIREESLLTAELEKTNQSYAIAKIAGIKLCEALREEYSFDAISIMPSNLYGPGDNYSLHSSHVIPALIRKFDLAREKDSESVTCLGSGNPLREFLYVDDLADACLFLLKNWDPDEKDSPINDYGEKLIWLNIGSEEETSIKNLATKISTLLEYKGEICWDTSQPDGTPRKKLNTERINKLGWESKTNLTNGLQKTINYYLKAKQLGQLRI